MWQDYETKYEITEIDQFESNIIGFVYLIEYTDYKCYIGKKNLYSIRTLPALKSGKTREGAERIFRKGSGKRIYFDKLKKESDWLKYQGSHAECKNRIPANKYILDYATSKLQLTYLEAKYLFSMGVLEDDKYLNDNILGTFYRSNLHGKNPSESD